MTWPRARQGPATSCGRRSRQAWWLSVDPPSSSTWCCTRSTCRNTAGAVRADGVHRGRHVRVHRDGAGPERGRRLRRPARPGLRRLLRRRRLRRRLVRDLSSSRRSTSTSVRRRRAAATLPGIHVNVWLLMVAAARASRRCSASSSACPRCACAATTWRSSRSASARSSRRPCNNGDNWFGHNVTNGPNGLTPIDPLGFGTTIHTHVHVPARPTTDASSNVDNYYYWTGLALVAVTLFCCIRLRDSRLGRAWVAIREDEIAAAAMGVPLMRTKTAGLRHRRVLRRRRRLLLRDLQELHVPAATSTLNISIFILCMVILGGMGNVWGVMLGGAVLAYLNYQGLGSIGNTINDTLRHHRSTCRTYSVRHLRRRDRDHDAVAAAGPDTQPPPARCEFAGRPRRASSVDATTP